MGIHVDVVRPDWIRSRLVRVAQVRVRGDTIEVDTDDDELKARLLQPYEHPETGEVLYPQKQPREFVENLYLVFNGSYLYATEPVEGEEPKIPEEQPMGLVHLD